ncbi:MAG: UDP-N-acetylmuramate--L-alanine ligase, partial [Parachlamydiaceae bacterium]|nr:UDP-N-acetylmuramate--L-alanine ligase [Parachlamydiaceae bacterium]
DGSFLKYAPFGAIVTNIDSDHLDHFVSDKALHAAFFKFIDNVTSTSCLFWCGDDPHLKQHFPVGVSYGFGEDCQLKISNYSQDGWQISFDVDFDGGHYEKIKLPLIGRHQALNGAAVFGLAFSLGVHEELIREAFSTFAGVKRRCEFKGEHLGIRLYDDYAHHPVEIKTTLEGIRSAIGDARLIAIYQPHRFTRARDCMGTFESVFDSADEVFIVNIYSAGESPIKGVTDMEVFEDIASMNSTPIQFIQNSKLVEFLVNYLYPQDVLVTLGAGDVTYVSKNLLNRFESSIEKK